MGGLTISDLGLSHFRSHRSLRLSLSGGLVAIVGPNGAGKTNILEAVSLLSPGRGLRRASAEDISRRPESIGWKVSARLSGPGDAHEVETMSEGGLARQVRLDGKAVPQTALGRLARILWLVPSMDRLWTDTADGRRRFLDRMALSFFPGHAEASLAYEKAMRDRNRLLRDGVADPHWYRALELQMADTAAVITANRNATLDRILRAQDGADTAFPKADLSLLWPEEQPQDLADALASGRPRDLAAGRTLVGPHRADLGAVLAAKGMPAEHCSTGEQKALLLSLVLANARALAADLGHAPILLLDEVAAHLDETRRADLYREILRLEAQALMTGTEAGLFAAVSSQVQLVTVAEGHGGSVVDPG